MREKEQESPSYPGLRTRYVIYQIDARVPGLPTARQKPFSTDEYEDKEKRVLKYTVLWEWRREMGDTDGTDESEAAKETNASAELERHGAAAAHAIARLEELERQKQAALAELDNAVKSMQWAHAPAAAAAAAVKPSRPNLRDEAIFALRQSLLDGMSSARVAEEALARHVSLGVATQRTGYLRSLPVSATRDFEC